MCVNIAQTPYLGQRDGVLFNKLNWNASVMALGVVFNFDNYNQDDGDCFDC